MGRNYGFFHVSQSLHHPRGSYCMFLVFHLVHSKEIPICFNALMDGSRRQSLFRQTDVARREIQAAAWNNPSWPSNKKESNSENEELPGGKESPHWKRTTPSFGLEEDEKEGRELSSQYKSHQEHGQAQWRRKGWSRPQQTQRGQTNHAHLLLQFNFKAMINP